MDSRTDYDPAARPGDVSEFKRALDKATAAVSFSANVGGSLVSSDGGWVIELLSRSDGSEVVVRKNGRRKNVLGARDLTKAAAKKHVQKLVRSFAGGAH